MASSSDNDTSLPEKIRVLENKIYGGDEAEIWRRVDKRVRYACHDNRLICDVAILPYKELIVRSLYRIGCAYNEAVMNMEIGHLAEHLGQQYAIMRSTGFWCGNTSCRNTAGRDETCSTVPGDCLHMRDLFYPILVQLQLLQELDVDWRTREQKIRRAIMSRDLVDSHGDGLFVRQRNDN